MTLRGVLTDMAVMRQMVIAATIATISLKSSMNITNIKIGDQRKTARPSHIQHGQPKGTLISLIITH